jgi:hypothetical protein
MEQAESMEDIIALESALTDVEYQIEQLSTTLNHYDALINFSTITLYLNEVVKVTEDVGQSDSLGQRMAAGFAASGEGLVRGTQEFLIWVSYNIVFTVAAVAILGAGAYVGVKQFKKVRREKSAPSNEKKNSQ